jgi:membrane protease YdiL (CAAX protease family)
MWSPGISAIVTSLLYSGSLNNLGWRLPKGKFLLLAFILPFTYILVYLLLWIIGISKLNDDYIKQIFTSDFLIEYPLLIALGLFYALGEEIGWRGFLTTRLLKYKTFLQSSFIVGFIWAIWHIPLLYIILSKSDINIVIALTIYSLGVIAETFMYTWFIKKSLSVWPCVILHTSYNFHIQEVFNNILIKNSTTMFITGEFGIGILFISIFIAFVLYFNRN